MIVDFNHQSQIKNRKSTMLNAVIRLALRYRSLVVMTSLALLVSGCGLKTEADYPSQIQNRPGDVVYDSELDGKPDLSIFGDGGLDLVEVVHHEVGEAGDVRSDLLANLDGQHLEVRLDFVERRPEGGVHCLERRLGGAP